VQAKGLIQQRNALVQQKAQIRDRFRGAATPAIDRQFADTTTQLAQTQQNMVAGARQLAELNQNLQSSQQSLASQAGSIDRLFDDWLPLCDPFGKLPSDAHRVALERLSQWIGEDEFFLPLFLARGLAYGHLGRHAEALGDLEKISHLPPRSELTVHSVCAYLIMKQGDTIKGAKLFSELFERCPKDPAPYVFRGYGFLTQDEYGKAERDFEQAVRCDKKCAEAYAALAGIWSDGLPARASRQKIVEYAQKACSLTEWSDWSHMAVLATVSAADGRFESASKTLEKALPVTPRVKRAEIERRLAAYRRGELYHPR
jgi:tetratricopeptide (TPR) repeat protein